MADIDEIRRANIKTIQDDVGGARALSDLVGMSYSQYCNLRDGAPDSKTGKPRGMRKETAWKFEDAGRKPRGWLDVDHSGRPAKSALANTSPYLSVAKDLEDISKVYEGEADEFVAQIHARAKMARRAIERIRGAPDTPIKRTGTR